MTDAGSFVSAGFDAMPARVAILNDEGEIVYTNSSWDSFRNEQGMPETAGGVGANYLAVCETSDDDDARETARGIRAVAADERDEFSLEYPCHTPEEERWFMMEARPYTHENEQFVLVMHVDITERRKLEQRTRDQADRMETFAKLLSHDLRNPLAVAMAHAEMLELDDDVDLASGDGKNDDTIPLRSSLERMESIIDDALVLVSTDDVEETEMIPLTTAVETAWAHVRTGPAAVSVADDVAIRANPDLVSHLFENLFRNAVEHSSTNPDSRARQDAVEHGSTSPRSQTHEGAVEHAGDETTIEIGALERPTVDGSADRSPFDGFYVEDDGPGIPAEHREQIFESGYSGDGGSGFGLAIVRKVADAHGWSIEATTGRDGGARFEVRDVAMLEM